MTAASKDLTERIRTLLERLVQSRRLSNDDREVIGDEIVAEARELPREFILDALDKAIGRNKRRREEAVYLLSEWTDVPAVVDRGGSVELVPAFYRNRTTRSATTCLALRLGKKPWGPKMVTGCWT